MTEPTHTLLESISFLDRAFESSLKRVKVAPTVEVEVVDESSFWLEQEWTDDFFRVPYQDLAGLLVKNKTKTGIDNDKFYKREEVSLLWNAINNLGRKHVLFVHGQPGIGKSTAVWTKVVEAAIAGDNILWISLDRSGLPVSTVYFQGKFYVKFDFDVRKELGVFVFNPDEIPLDTVVVDGCSTSTSTTETVNTVRRWVSHRGTGSNCRAIFTASTKVERLRAHQHDDVHYHLVQSWTPREFERSLIRNDGKTTPIFDACASLFYDEYGIDDTLLGANVDGEDEDEHPMNMNMDEKGDTNMDSNRANDASADDTNSSSMKRGKQLSRSEISEVLTSRYAYSGGSARWMFNYTKDKIEYELKEFCKTAANRRGILDGNIGPTSNAATNYFFGSSRKQDGNTEYFLVSKRAVEILTEEAGASSFGVLYRFADRLENPSFEGWIVEADVFCQLDSARKRSSDFHPRYVTEHCARFRPEAIHTWEHTKNKNRVQVLRSKNAKKRTKTMEKERVRQIANKLIPKNCGKSIVCKPTVWNQGGYDLFFVDLVEFGGDTKRISLRFAQITKGISHSLKGGYMFSVIEFFQEAGVEVASVEIAFLLTPKNVSTFTLGEVEGMDFLKAYALFGTQVKWQNSEDIAKYELQLSRKDTAGGI